MLETIDRKFTFVAVNPCNGHFYTEKDAIVFCAKDAALPAALRTYRAECLRLGCDVSHIHSVELLMERVRKFQDEKSYHVPDTDTDCEIRRCIGGEGL